MCHQNTSMARRVLTTLLVFSGAIHVSSQFNSAVQCPQSPDVTGYVSIEALNNDMEAERDRIQSEGVESALSSYTFTLCPNQVFDAANEALTPVLSGAQFVCGATGSSQDSCSISNGQNQVLIEDSTVAGYPIETVGFAGVTFSQFGTSAIAGGADSTTTVILNDPTFLVSTLNATRLIFVLLYSRPSFSSR